MMSVSDNGRGFELPIIANDFASQGKLGLAGMSERVQLLNNGRFAIESTPGKGTVVKVEIAA